jgi:6-phosphogluconolactonase
VVARAAGRMASLGTNDFGEAIVSLSVAPSGRIDGIVQLSPMPWPSYASITHPEDRLYAVSLGDESGASRILSFAISNTGELIFMNEARTGGTLACHVCVDQSGRRVITANYGSGGRRHSFSINPTQADGSLLEPSTLWIPSGSGTHPRQDAPHPHMAQLTPDGQWVITADLGTDEVASWLLDDTRGLVAQQVPAARVQAGAGPRHFVFHPSDRIFVCNELDSTITTMSFNSTTGLLAYREHISAKIDQAIVGEADCAAIRLSPDQKFLYVSNRGRNSISIYSVEAESLLPVQEVHLPELGGIRDFLVHDDIVCAAAFDTDRVGLLRRNKDDGRIDAVPMQSVELPAPMFVLMI